MEMECDKCGELQEAFEYAVTRFWRHYDTYGPFWRLFGPFCAVMESLDDDGNVKPFMRGDFARIVRQAKQDLKAYVEWQQEQEDQTSIVGDDLNLLNLMDEELLKLREAA